ncbi:MAG: trypsin-like peptidase domain-containing protein, partial [Planctomycetota bacterium]|nr:trypsin-like peptidase domain-containing protein [Planctomycetota bacterium]
MTVAFVIRTRFDDEQIRAIFDMDEDFNFEITGVMVDPSGLIVCPEGLLFGTERDMGPPMRVAELRASEIRVTIGREPAMLDASLVGRDEKAGLVWIQITKPGDRVFEHFDLEEVEVPEVGSEVYGLTRMGKEEGRTIMVQRTNVAAVSEGGDDRCFLDPGIEVYPGTPLFDQNGRFIGIAAMFGKTPRQARLRAGL